MKKKFFVVFFLVLLFVSNSLIMIHSSEKSALSFTHDTVSPSQLQIVKFNLDDNMKKSRNMKILGGIGIPTFIIGFGLQFGGGFLYGYSVATEPALNAMANDPSIRVPESWFYLKWVGLGLAAGGTVLFIGGLAMTISGFIMAKRFKNKSAKLSLLFDYNFENEVVTGGLRILL